MSGDPLAGLEDKVDVSSLPEPVADSAAGAEALKGSKTKEELKRLSDRNKRKEDEEKARLDAQVSRKAKLLNCRR